MNSNKLSIKRINKISAVFLAALFLLFSGCTDIPEQPPEVSAPDRSEVTAVPYTDALQLIAEYPHNTTSFTQGLFFCNGEMYESAGKYGESALYKNIDIETGKCESEHRFAQDIFAEGSTVFNGKLYVLTWKENSVFVFNPQTLSLENTLNYPRQGWGLTTDGEHLIASDGTSSLYFTDENMDVVRTVTVTKNGEEIANINELEYINGYIWANVWFSNEILIIDKDNGKVVKAIDFTGLYESESADRNDVLNGIAYNSETDRLYITGKRWNSLYEFKINK